jgi:hypothetical protein
MGLKGITLKGKGRGRHCDTQGSILAIAHLHVRLHSKSCKNLFVFVLCDLAFLSIGAKIVKVDCKVCTEKCNAKRYSF